MIRIAAWIAVVGAMLGGAACRQSDGPMPVPVDEQPNRVEDLGRDLKNVASGQPEAEAELLSDLLTLDSEEPPLPLAQEVVRELGGALRGKPLGDAEAQQIARALFVVSAGRDLSQRQIGRAGEGVTEVLLKVGADETAARRASAAVTALASAVTRNRKRWYHVGT
jgi:hypothetical protein